MIGNLQLLRGIAALGVVFFHTDFLLPGDWHTQFFGVSTFFVISGFIMCFITRDVDAHAGSFLLRRTIRIVPLYWFCTIVWILIFYVAPPLLYHPAYFWEYIQIDYPLLLRSLTFYPPQPEGTFPLLAVGWTLNLEAYFYLVFAIALLISRRLAPLIVWCIVFAVIEANDYGVDNWLIRFYSHWPIHYFLDGIGMFYVWTYTKNYLPKRPTITGCAAIIIGCYGYVFMTPILSHDYPTIVTYANIYCPVMLTAAFLFAASAGADVTWRPLILIGDASYAIYLTHLISLELLARNIPVTMLRSKNLGIMFAVVITSTLVGIAVHLWIDRPIGNIIKTLLKRSPHGIPQQPPIENFQVPAPIASVPPSHALVKGS